MKLPLRSALGALVLLAAGLTARGGNLILRQTLSLAPPSGTASATPGAATTTQITANAQNQLVRTAQAVQAVRAMLVAARNLALAGPNNLGLDPNHAGLQLPNVPDGLTAGGLQVAVGVPADPSHPAASENAALWQGAALPAQSANNGQTTVTVTQTAQQALLTWQTFNIGKNTTLSFDQSAGGANVSQWIAFNKINDPSGVPSQILGSIQAPGQVYVINQNGIIFGGSSQANLHALVASSLPINDNLISLGLLNNPDLQFLFSQLTVPQLSTGATMPEFDPPAPNTPTGRDGDVVVQAGAVLSSPTTPDHVGGKIALIGPNVSNAGTISTPDGQTILAAGNQVALTAHPSTDPSLRGLDVYIGTVDKSSGTATNSGLIEAPRADVTLAGSAVNQNGVIDSSTSVALNGRIDLLASHDSTVTFNINAGAAQFNQGASGAVTLGADSVTQILPELASTDTVAGTQLALLPQINFQGLTVHFGANSEILAPSASVAVNAGSWMQANGIATFVSNAGQIYLDAGATIDVSGSSGVSVPVTENIVSAELLGPELANSPLQQNGPLRGQTIQVDLRQTGTYNGQPWVGTPLADISGYVALIQRSVGELTTAGGTVTLSAGGSVVMQPGSAINVSGGWIDYQGGVVQTTKVLSGGHVYDISQATPNLVYDGIDTSPLLAGIYEPGYIQGGNGGAISITAPAMALDGSLFGNTVAGPRQRTSPPNLSSLSLAFQQQAPDPKEPTTYIPFSPTPPAIVFQAGSSLPVADPFALAASGNPMPLQVERSAEVDLPSALLSAAGNGFGKFNLNDGDGTITVAAGVVLLGSAGGSIAMAAANLDLEGSVSVPGGSLGFVVTDYSPFTFGQLSEPPPASQLPAPDPTRGHFILGAAATLSTAGLIVDDRPGSSASPNLPLVINGGSISINSYDVDLRVGSMIDSSGGVALNTTGKITYGSGGGIVIKAGQVPNLKALVGGQAVLDSGLQAFSVGKGGSLSLQVPLVQIGGTVTEADTTLLLSPDFFSQGGFSNFTLQGLGTSLLPAVLIAPGTMLAPAVQSWQAVVAGNAVKLTPTLLPTGVRPPVSLNFVAAGVPAAFNLIPIRGDFVMGAGAMIQTDPLGSVSIKGDTAVVLGSIVAPGGAITITGAGDSIAIFHQPQALPTVDLGPDSLLSTEGTTVLTPNPLNYRTGSILAGGTISVAGDIVAEAGARLDVSGASGVLDLLPSYGAANGAPNTSFAGSFFVPTRIDSNGGSITLSGGQELFMDATLVGAAGGPTALGGSLSISSGHFLPSGSQTPLDVDLTLTQSEPSIPAPFYAAGTTAIGNVVVDAQGNPLPQHGYVAVDRFSEGGFNAITLSPAVDNGGAVQFSGPVSITAGGSLRIGSSSGGVLSADPNPSFVSSLTLTAPYVALGQDFQAPPSPLLPSIPFADPNGAFYFLPVYGPGSLTVTSSHIDLGNLSLQNIGQANLVASNGDIRGDGTFDVAGAISLTAGQIYPPTEVSFTIAAYDYQVGGATQPGSITVLASGSRLLPLSAGGELNLYGSIITQGGTLRAPIGTINLGWNGSGAAPVDPITNQAVTPTGQLTLATGSVTSVSAVDPATGQALTIPYGTNLNGVSWIDPAGTDITISGVPGKAVAVSAVNVTDQSGASIDLSGGGDLYAYRWVSGVGGTRDVLASSSSFAVIPGYQANYAPYDPGYANNSLAVGDQVYLNASPGLPAGSYTLLPARYALLSGAFLVTPQSGVPAGTVVQPDGSALVSGYRFNALNPARTGQPLNAMFEVDSPTVVRSRAEYDNSLANTFLSQSALNSNAAVPRLPVDAGQLVLAATRSLSIAGGIAAAPAAGGLGALIDIGSSSDIYIESAGKSGPAGSLTLDAAALSAFNAGSLLIGGFRQTGANGTTITVTTSNLTVDNAGVPLTGPDLVLVANDRLTLAPGADIESTDILSSPADTLLLGTANVAGSGNGALVRVSSDASAQIIRSGVDSSSAPTLSIGARAQISGASLTLDSTSATLLDPTASLKGSAVFLNSGQISLQLTDPGSLQPTAGLVLSGSALQNLQAGTQALSLLSYSSIDIYGTGQVGALDSTGRPTVASLALHAGEIRGFNQGVGTVTFAAQNILLDNSAGVTGPGPAATPAGTLAFNAGTIRLGANQLDIDQYASLILSATGGVLAQSSGGLATPGTLTVTTPLLTGATAASQTITADGALTLQAPAGGTGAPPVGGLDASLTLAGLSITDNAAISLPSGALTLHATGGDLLVGNLTGTRLDAGGTAQNFYDLVKYTDGGQITLIADAGNVNVAAGSTINVAAQPGGGNAGSLSVSAPAGAFAMNGTVPGQGGAGGQGGIFSLDAGTIPGGRLAPLDAALNAGGFVQSRTFRVRSGNVLVDGLATAQSFNLSADQGSITVAGTIDASGATGGAIALEAGGSVTLLPGSLLTVAAQNFNDAGKGGAVSLEAGCETNGSIRTDALVDIQTGSTVDLSVASNVPSHAVSAVANSPVSLPGNDTITSTSAGTITFADGTTAALAANVSTTVAGASSVTLASDGVIAFAGSAALGDFTGTLHLRAPQTAGNTDLQVNPINGTILNPSGVVVEGCQLFDLTAAGGAITSTVEANVKTNGTTFGSGTAAIAGRLLANNGGGTGALAAVLSIEPGAEIINRTGDLTFASTWNLSTYRFGPNSVPGILTLRAAGNLTFNYKASLSDGFTSGAYNATLLPVGIRSWSYRLVAGADFGAADFRRVQPLDSLAAGAGSLLLGKNAPALPTSTSSSTVSTYFQTIRTGTGSIDIAAGRDVQLLDSLATIYTAGTTAAALANFSAPFLTYSNSQIGTNRSPYAAQYSVAGGDVMIVAQNDIIHELLGLPDSSRELPDNWLYRQGAVDPATGQFESNALSTSAVESTSWWIDFSNFFEGVGALGGGNVSLIAGHDVSNVDAVAPTNARMPKGTPNAASLVELGGGDLLVRAGHDINGGVYYVERGQGTLAAGQSIVTNSTRAAVSQNDLQNLANSGQVPDASTWLPTTLFLGKGSFTVAAGADLLLGPVANPFLLPQGINNSFHEKTYFQTYAATDAVTLSSLAGTVTIKDSSDNGAGSLAAWIARVDDIFNNTDSFASESQTWLRLLETDITSFTTVSALMPPALRATAFTGNIDLIGSLTLAPSPVGTVELAAAGSINGMQPNGVFNPTAVASTGNPLDWGSAIINLSDADPVRLPGITAPLSLPLPTTGPGLPPLAAAWNTTPLTLMDAIDSLFGESGSTTGANAVIQTKQDLHAPGPLHSGDADPVHLYAANGAISGVTLFAGKAARVVAGGDITDLALYLQNNQASDLSLVAAGRDLIAFDPNSPLRVAAQAPGNELIFYSGNTSGPGSGRPTDGDIQIGGPGTLEVLAGRNLDLGVGPNNSDGTGVGITSIGNARNPYLPFGGAAVIAGAGIGGSDGLAAGQPDFKSFIAQFLNPAAGVAESARYLPDLGVLLGLAGAGDAQIWTAFNQLTAEQQDGLALDIFYLVLRDAGRDHNAPSSPGFGNYDAGYAAIAALFPGNAWQGYISLTSREIKTANGGDISLFAPGGALTVGYDLGSNQAVDQGILTEDGGNISIFTRDSVNVGTSRIFTLRGGNEIIWSSAGDIAAGASSKTVQSAPPTRVLIDPQSGDVQTDLAGLATGGGIGVLETVTDVPPGDIDLIAPAGAIDAGDAGIRVSGNLNLAAVHILNVSNIQVAGASTGTPVAAPPSLGGLSNTTAAAASAAATSAVDEVSRQSRNQAMQQENLPSLITVEVLGYGGDDV